jgi:hypothetical protein
MIYLNLRSNNKTWKFLKKENLKEDELALLSKALLNYLNAKDLTIQSSFIYNTPQIVKNKKSLTGKYLAEKLS